jgi:uncharacterized protein (DUF305 family)
MYPLLRWAACLPLLACLALSGACSGDSGSGPLGPTAMGPGAADVRMGMPGGGMPGSGMPGTGGMQVTSEFAYLAEMIPHHEEAIVTAGLLLAGTRRSEMRDFASAIIDGQSAEVAQMRAWLAAWYPGRDPAVSYTPMMRDLAGLTGEALDEAFLEDMIPHHMMAVMMSQQLLGRGLVVHPDAAPFARRIRDVQQQEIGVMQGWLRAWSR